MLPSPADPWLEDRILLTKRPQSGRPVMHQRWDHLLFLHWEIPAPVIASLLPPGLEVDLFGGQAYVGLVPFTMARVRPARLPSVWGVSNFHETNVRTYVRTAAGRPGVWFFSLDAASWIAATLGRTWFHLPYYYARMTLQARERIGGGRTLTYTSRRLAPQVPAATTRIEATVDGPMTPATPGSLEFWLAERYLLYTLGRTASGFHLMQGRVHHSSYPLQPARLDRLQESALAAAGITRPDETPVAHYAQRVVVEVFGLEPVPTANPRAPELGASEIPRVG